MKNLFLRAYNYLISNFITQYHDPIKSLVAQTHLEGTISIFCVHTSVSSQVAQEEYTYLIRSHPIVSDIMYTNSIVRDGWWGNQICFTEKHSEKLRIEGRYGPLFNIIEVFDANNNNLRVDSFIHEEGHKLIDNIFKNNCKPYHTGDAKNKIIYEKTIRQVLYNIALLCVESNLNKTDHLSTWEIGQNLAKKLTNAEHNHKLYYTLSTILSIYELYDREREHTEFIVRLPQIIAKGFYDDNQVQQILEPLERYWQNYIVDDIHKYLEKNDYSHYCSPLPVLKQYSLYDLFVKKCPLNRAMLRKSIIERKQYDIASILIDRDSRISLDTFKEMLLQTKNDYKVLPLVRKAIEKELIMEESEQVMSFIKVFFAIIDNKAYYALDALLEKEFESNFYSFVIGKIEDPHVLLSIINGAKLVDEHTKNKYTANFKHSIATIILSCHESYKILEFLLENNIKISGNTFSKIIRKSKNNSEEVIPIIKLVLAKEQILDESYHDQTLNENYWFNFANLHNANEALKIFSERLSLYNEFEVIDNNQCLEENTIKILGDNIVTESL
ncbi:MAG: hypothetical protein HRU36_01865 [Rickettsiales bacterium]|nr:hypothetical protein [Rickettsiales bacterium]